MDSTRNTNATKLLGDDHRGFQTLFQSCRAATEDEAARLAEELFKELEIHSRMEECLVYPRLAMAGAPENLVQQFGQRHGEVRRLVSEARLSAAPDAGPSSGRSARLERIMELVHDHVAEEEDKAFPMLEADPALDRNLGEALATLKRKLEMFPPAHQCIDVDVPVREAYNQWTQFEAFPRFMDDVREVRQLDDTHLLWRTDVAGKEVQWTAAIYEQIPDQRIAWTSVDGAPNTGAVTFRPLTSGATRVLVEVTYEPHGLVEDLGALLGLLPRRVGACLEKFKAFIESRSRETGAWRGRIEGNPVQPQLPGLGSPDRPGKEPRV